MGQKQINWKDIAWVLSIASQLGISIAGSVLIGLVVGWWLDNRLHTLPWITLLLTLAGTIVGPIIAYRFLIKAIQQQDIGRGQGTEDRGQEV